MASSRLDPHHGESLLTAGAPLHQARAALILVHGRGATAANILELAEPLAHSAFAFLAPQAAGNVWYPNSFTAPLASNEPSLSSALGVLTSLLERLGVAGIPAERTMLLGFSQGACLALEYGARHARRYGGVVALSGGLIGPDDTPRDYPGSLAGTPVFLGCSDVDPYIPWSRVEQSADVMRAVGADVTARVYAGMDHTINDDELAFVRSMMSRVVEM